MDSHIVISIKNQDWQWPERLWLVFLPPIVRQKSVFSGFSYFFACKMVGTGYHGQNQQIGFFTNRFSNATGVWKGSFLVTKKEVVIRNNSVMIKKPSCVGGIAKQWDFSHQFTEGQIMSIKTQSKHVLFDVEGCFFLGGTSLTNPGINWVVSFFLILTEFQFILEHVCRQYIVM